MFICVCCSYVHTLPGVQFVAFVNFGTHHIFNLTGHFLSQNTLAHHYCIHIQYIGVELFVMTGFEIWFRLASHKRIFFFFLAALCKRQNRRQPVGTVAGDLLALIYKNFSGYRVGK